jgi:hypothetical protein
MTNDEMLRQICAALGLDYAAYAAAYDTYWRGAFDRSDGTNLCIRDWVYYRFHARKIPHGHMFWLAVQQGMRDPERDKVQALQREYRKAKVRLL